MSFLASSTRAFSLPLDKRVVVPAVALAGVFAAIVIGVAVGPVYIGPGTVWQAILGHDVGTSNIIVNQIRLPRVLVGGMVGASLAMSGAILQGVTRNPLGDPQIFGISAGAGVVAVTAVVFFPTLPLSVVQPLAFGGGIAAGAFAYLMAWRGGVSPARLALAGVAVTSILIALISGVLVTSSFSAQVGLRWLIGGLLGRSWDDVWLLLPYFVGGSAGAILLARQLNVIALGDEVATSLGQHVERTRFLLLAVAALLASAAVSVAGLIGFVGLIVPHFVRLLLGNDYRFLIPTSALCGAVLLMLADTAARTVFQPHEVPVGVLTAVMGGPVFILLVRQRA
jgi:iron complex transport system permease protein